MVVMQSSRFDEVQVRSGGSIAAFEWNGGVIPLQSHCI